MVADDLGDLGVCETWVLSDYGLLVVLAVEDKSCRMGCQKMDEAKSVGVVMTGIGELGRLWVDSM